MKRLVSLVVSILCRFVSGASNVPDSPIYSYRVNEADR